MGEVNAVCNNRQKKYDAKFLRVKKKATRLFCGASIYYGRLFFLLVAITRPLAPLLISPTAR